MSALFLAYLANLSGDEAIRTARSRPIRNSSRNFETDVKAHTCNHCPFHGGLIGDYLPTPGITLPQRRGARAGRGNQYAARSDHRPWPARTGFRRRRRARRGDPRTVVARSNDALVVTCRILPSLSVMIYSPRARVATTASGSGTPTEPPERGIVGPVDPYRAPRRRGPGRTGSARASRRDRPGPTSSPPVWERLLHEDSLFVVEQRIGPTCACLIRERRSRLFLSPAYSMAWCHGRHAGIALAPRLRLLQLDSAHGESHRTTRALPWPQRWRGSKSPQVATQSGCHTLPRFERPDRDLCFTAGVLIDDSAFGSAAVETARFLIERHYARERLALWSDIQGSKTRPSCSALPAWEFIFSVFTRRTRVPSPLWIACWTRKVYD